MPKIKQAAQSQEEQKFYVDDQTGRAVSTQKGTKFSSGRIATYCKNGRYAERIGAGAPIFVAGVMEYIVFEILELAAAEAKRDKKQRINPQHLMMAIKNDDELAKYFGSGDFVNAGFVPKVKPTGSGDGKKKKAEVESDSDE